MRNVSEKVVDFLFDNYFSENRAVNETMWRN